MSKHQQNEEVHPGWIRYNVRKICFPFISIVIFVQDTMALLSAQAIGLFLLSNDPLKVRHLLDATKRAFIVILMTILTIVAPSTIRITTDNKTITPSTFYRDPKKGRICSQLRNNSITICNHQIYTDWILLWWLAYTSTLAGKVYIMLKKSLEKIPVLGYGMKNFNFIFMDRKWASDKGTLDKQLTEIDARARGISKMQKLHDKEIKKADAGVEPYNLILFPEGTVLSENTRNQSLAYAKKVGRSPFKCVLLPHTTGLRFSLQRLKPSLDILYDVTIGYSGVKQDDYGENTYGLKSIFFEGKYPKLAC